MLVCCNVYLVFTVHYLSTEGQSVILLQTNRQTDRPPIGAYCYNIIIINVYEFVFPYLEFYGYCVV